MQPVQSDSSPFRSMTWDSGASHPPLPDADTPPHMHFMPGLALSLAEERFATEFGDENFEPNFYRYVSNNPLKDTDPSGLAKWITRGRVDRFGYHHAYLYFNNLCMGSHRVGFWPLNAQGQPGGHTFWGTTGGVLPGNINSGTGHDNDAGNEVSAINDDPRFEAALCACVKKSAAAPPRYQACPGTHFYVCGSWVQDMWNCAEQSLCPPPFVGIMIM